MKDKAEVILHLEKKGKGNEVERAKENILRDSFWIQYVKNKRSKKKKKYQSISKYQGNNIRRFPRTKDTSFQIATTERHSLLDENRIP